MQLGVRRVAPSPDVGFKNEADFRLRHFRKIKSVSPTFVDNPFLDSLLSDRKEKKLPPLHFNIHLSEDSLLPMSCSWRPTKSIAMQRIRTRIEDRITQFKHREQDLADRLRDSYLKEFEEWQAEKINRSLEEMKKPRFLHVYLPKTRRRQ